MREQQAPALLGVATASLGSAGFQSIRPSPQLAILKARRATPPLSWLRSCRIVGGRGIERVVRMLTPGCDDSHCLIDWNTRQALRAVGPAVAGKRLALFEFEALQIVLRCFLQRGGRKRILDCVPEGIGNSRPEIEKQDGHHDRNKGK